ncbi:MAG: DUF6311 domain-containing protein [Brevinemataceae bacterium]
MINHKILAKQQSQKSFLKFLSVGLPIVLTIWFTLFFFGSYINPKSFSYLPQSVRENHITGLFFRSDTWSYPLTLISNIENIPLALTDSVPFFALIFKILNITDIQYFGLWILLSNILSAFFIYRIAFNLSHRRFTACLISMICITIPFLWYHISYTPWIAGYWVILWAYSLFFKSNEFFSKEWYCLIFISALIHPYFSLICFLLSFAEILQLYIYKHSVSAVQGVSLSSNCLAIVITILGISGVFYLPTYIEPTLSLQPLNLFGFPSSEYNLSYLYPGTALSIGLGIGVLFATVYKRMQLKTYLPLIAIFIILFLLSISNGLLIKNFPLFPHSMLPLHYVNSVFSSGPKFLIPILLIIPAVLAHTANLLRSKNNNLEILFLSITFITQTFFFSPAINNDKSVFQALNNDAAKFLDNTSKIVWIFDDNIPLTPPCYEKIAFFAFNNNITINAAPVMRFPTNYKEQLKTAAKHFQQNIFSTNTVYILTTKYYNSLKPNGKILTLDHIVLFKP